MKAENFIALAGKLAAQAATDGAVARTATSRAYYGAFHLARLYLSSLNFAVGKDHDLHKPLLATRNSVAMDTGRLLSMLYEDRRKADYEILNVNCENQAVAQVSVEQAERVRLLVLQLDTEPLRSEIQAAIVRYQQQVHPRNI